MNSDHANANLAYARAFAGLPTATSAQMVAIDRLGFDLLAATSDGLQPARVNFDEPVDTPLAVTSICASRLSGIPADTRVLENLVYEMLLGCAAEELVDPAWTTTPLT